MALTTRVPLLTCSQCHRVQGCQNEPLTYHAKVTHCTEVTGLYYRAGHTETVSEFSHRGFPRNTP